MRLQWYHFGSCHFKIIMKTFRTIGIAAIILLFISAFLPWVYINFGKLHDAYLTGMNTGITNYGKPAILGLFFSFLFLITVFIPKVWAKRTGIFFAVIVLAWGIRNYFLFTCEMGYCPHRQIGLYLTLLASLAIMVSALTPYVPEEENG